MTEQRIGDRIDAAGVTLDLSDSDLVSDYLVVGKVIREDGEVTLVMGVSDGMDWITQLGLITSAQGIVGGGYEHEQGDA